jgi:hypothetical protein
MMERFDPAELQNMALAEPFDFTQELETLKIPARTKVNPYNFGTMLFDLATDPEQATPLVDEAVERRMIALMVEWLRWNDAPLEQFAG